MSELKFQALFEHMQDEHGLTLVESELEEIVRLACLTDREVGITKLGKLNKAYRDLRKSEERAAKLAYEVSLALAEYHGAEALQALPEYQAMKGKA